MARSVRANYAVLAFLALLGGCAGPAGRSGPTSLTAVAHPSRRPLAHTSESRRAAATPPAVSQVAFQPPAETAPELLTATDEPAGHSADPSDASDPFLGQAELSVGQLVAEVEARNPSLQAVSEAWRAATERCPQVVSLDDPMFTAMMSPGGVGMDRGGGWMVQAAQKIPWPGKRALRGTAAEAEADVMQGDIGDTRLRLAEAARTAFYDYYLARRQSEVNASTRKLVTRFREIAWNKYQVGQATQQDVLQADVELASLESRRTELARDGEVAMARINTLLHRGPDHPVPPRKSVV